MTLKTPLSTLDTLGLVGRSEVALPLSRALFSEHALAAVADRFPATLRIVDGRLLLKPAPDAHTLLRDVLQHLYVAHQ